MIMIRVCALIEDLDKIRKTSPLVHNITNYVVMNNTANALLAIGASPVMAHSSNEVEDMTRIASSLVINIGTLDSEWVKSMLIAGKTALGRGIPVIFDPVGAGATSYRTETCKRIIDECHPAIIRGNGSEIMSLAGCGIQTKGVDSTESSLLALDSARSLALATGSVVVISGETDYITDGIRIETVSNGSPLMEKVTGMGCTATAVVAAFAAVNPNKMEAAWHGMTLMGIAGEIASGKASGNGSMQVHFLDELCLMTDKTIKDIIKL